MMDKYIQDVILEKIHGSGDQINILFQLLKIREHNISNLSAPTFNEHTQFVKNHPYRAWYLIKVNNLYVGSVYIMKSNCIGVSLQKDASIFPKVINMINQKHKPLKEIKSVRPAHFYINISPNNKKIRFQLTQIGAIKIQLTYSLPLMNLEI
jgi:hypothetical protein